MIFSIFLLFWKWCYKYDKLFLATLDKAREIAEGNDRTRFTPTPRRSIHTYKVTESSQQTIFRGPDGKVSQIFIK